MTQRQFLLTPTNRLEHAQAFGLPLALLAARLEPDGHLRHDLPPDVTGGLLVVGGSGPDWQSGPDRGSPGTAVGEILSLCRQRRFYGVMLDLEIPPTPYLTALIRGLEEGLSPGGRGLFLPESYGNYGRRPFLYLSSAISGGSLQRRLEEAADRYGPERLAVCLRLVRADFSLPASKGLGKPLTAQQLQTLTDRLEPRIFFSKDLCANYFTYMSRDTGAHFILFDTAASLVKKRALATSLGIHRFFLLYPEVEDILAEYLRQTDH